MVPDQFYYHTKHIAPGEKKKKKPLSVSLLKNSIKCPVIIKILGRGPHNEMHSQTFLPYIKLWQDA